VSSNTTPGAKRKEQQRARRLAVVRTQPNQSARELKKINSRRWFLLFILSANSEGITILQHREHKKFGLLVEFTNKFVTVTTTLTKITTYNNNSLYSKTSRELEQKIRTPCGVY
jgi:hypothetical protein